MPPSKTHLAGVAFGLALSSFGAYQMFKLPPVLPLLLETYGYDRTLAGGFMSVYALVGLLVSIFVGRQIERHGLAGPVLFALGAMIAGNLLGLVAPESGAVVLAGRALEGLAFAVFAIAGPTLTNLSSSARALPIVMGLTAAWIPIGQVTATLLAQPALASWGWQSLWIAGGLGCVLLAGCTLGMRSALPRGRKPARNGGEAESPITPRERWLLALGGFGFLIFSGQYFAYMTWMPQYLIEVYGFSLDGAVWGYLLPVVVLMVFNVIAGRILQLGVPVGALLTLALASQAAVWWLLPWTGSDWTGIVSVVIYGIGGGVAPTCLFALPSTILGAGRGAAGAYGLMMTGRNIGVFIGPILLAGAFELTGGWDLSAPIFGAFTTAGALGALWLWLTLRRR